MKNTDQMHRPISEMFAKNAPAEAVKRPTGDDDTSDLVPPPITPEAAFKAFHGKYHGRR